MVSIHSDYEQDFIEDYHYDSRYSFSEQGEQGFVWIGAKTSNGTSEWTWDDETAFDYSHWGDGEDDGNDGFCSYLTYFNERKWKDAPCDADGEDWDIQKYMCKKFVGMFLK